jgi:hypothetical protein
MSLCAISDEFHSRKGQVISKCLFGVFNSPKKRTKTIKQADYLLLYEQNLLKEGTEALVLKKTAESS